MTTKSRPPVPVAVTGGAETPPRAPVNFWRLPLAASAEPVAAAEVAAGAAASVAAAPAVTVTVTSGGQSVDVAAAEESVVEALSADPLLADPEEIPATACAYIIRRLIQMNKGRSLQR